MNCPAKCMLPVCEECTVRYYLPQPFSSFRSTCINCAVEIPDICPPHYPYGLPSPVANRAIKEAEEAANRKRIAAINQACIPLGKFWARLATPIPCPFLKGPNLKCEVKVRLVDWEFHYETSHRQLIWDAEVQEHRVRDYVDGESAPHNLLPFSFELRMNRLEDPNARAVHKLRPHLFSSDGGWAEGEEEDGDDGSDIEVVRRRGSRVLRTSSGEESDDPQIIIHSHRSRSRNRVGGSAGEAGAIQVDIASTVASRSWNRSRRGTGRGRGRPRGSRRNEGTSLLAPVNSNNTTISGEHVNVTFNMYGNRQ